MLHVTRTYPTGQVLAVVCFASPFLVLTCHIVIQTYLEQSLITSQNCMDYIGDTLGTWAYGNHLSFSMHVHDDDNPPPL
jgi:hypothetical protein